MGICVPGLQLNGMRILFRSFGEEALCLVGRTEALIGDGGGLDPDGGPVFPNGFVNPSLSI
jgi:hypothetical protein